MVVNSAGEIITKGQRSGKGVIPGALDIRHHPESAYRLVLGNNESESV